MDAYATELDSLASSQATLGDMDKENASPIFSSPQKAESTYTQRQRRPPTVTPKRFSRFFTPRVSSRSKSLRQRLDGKLRDVTLNAANGAHDALRLQGSPDRPQKRRKYVISFPDGNTESSPVKSSTTDLSLHDSVVDSTDESEEEIRPDERPPLPQPIRRLAHSGAAHRLLVRSFGDLECAIRDRPERGLTQQSTSDADSYVTTPQDSHDFRSSTRSLPFCTTACNTNSLVAVGDETGAVHMIDTAKDTDFAKPHIKLKTHNNAIMDMSFSSCDYILATTSGDQTIRVIDVQAQRPISVLAGHRSSIKQVHFQPDNDKLLTTSARDGIVNVWDLRCCGSAQQTLRLGYRPQERIHPATVYPYNIMLAGPAHRTTCARDVIERVKHSTDSVDYPSGVSITAIHHLTGSRSHLLLTASEVNSSLKLFDLRVAGRNTKSDKYGFEVPISCTPILRSHKRPRGISALALSTDGARAYSVCTDSTVWVYSTQHLILGSATEMAPITRRTRLTPPDQVKEGLGPLYGFRHPKFGINSFYIRAAVRKSGHDQEEMLAVGSKESCPILFPTDERRFRHNSGERHEQDQLSRQLFAEPVQASPPIYNTGTALVNGHRREVTALSFAPAGELVTVADDFTARCWRQDSSLAHQLQSGKGDTWRHGWAESKEEMEDELV